MNALICIIYNVSDCRAFPPVACQPVTGDIDKLTQANSVKISTRFGKNILKIGNVRIEGSQIAKMGRDGKLWDNACK